MIFTNFLISKKMNNNDCTRPDRIYTARAKNYDLTHSLVTLGADIAWRRSGAEAIPETARRVLDLCTGTGLTAAQIGRSHPGARVVGIDITWAMVSKAAQRAMGHSTQSVLNGNVEMLPFASGSFDAVVSICGLGGVDNPLAAVREVRRVMHNNGVFYALEMCTPLAAAHRIWHRLAIAPWVKRWWAFRDIDLPALVRSAGFEDVDARNEMARGLGSICKVVARL